MKDGAHVGQIQKIQEKWSVGSVKDGHGNTLVLVTLEYPNGAHISWLTPQEAKDIAQQMIQSADASKIVVARNFHVRPS